MPLALESYTIRHAWREDVVDILAMIRELAEYEREPDAVEATEVTLLSTLAFATEVDPDAAATAVSPTRPARCLLIFPADTPKRPAGMALYFSSYSTWRARAGIYLEDLYVRANFRRRGYGRALIVELAKEVVKMRGGRLEWSVLRWNEPSITFYKTLGANLMAEWLGMRVDGDALVKLAGIEPPPEGDDEDLVYG